MKLILHIVSMLVITISLIIFYSFSEKKLKIPYYKNSDTGKTEYFEIKKTGLKKFFYQIPDDIIAKKIAVRDTINNINNEIDTTSQRILLIGDSMLEGLMRRLKDYTVYNNHKIKTVIWYSSSTAWYGSSDTLKYYIKKFKPTYVFFVLGANELFVPNIVKKRQKFVNHIKKQLVGVKYIWIGPPNWKDDTGINKLILKNVGEKRYFPSKNLSYRRTKDGAHPTMSSAAVWMDSIAVWVMKESMYPIILKKPKKRTKTSANVTILQPLK